MRARRAVLATGNRGKVAEIAALLAPYDWQIQPQSDFEVPAVPETGLTFVENALIKARNACRHTGLPAIADDSGLEVDYLDGAPGIHSARYAADGATDADNLALLLERMRPADTARRTARFRCVVVFLRHATDPTPRICQGTWEGAIATEAAGSGGFGYDPVFLPAGLTRTAAQLGAAEKNAVSHRARALTALVDQLADTKDE